MSASPPVHRLVLAGAGHAHAQVLKAWPDRAPPGVELVVVSPHAMAPYSGMVPGWLAGTYGFQDIVIDFPALCARAGARWVPAAIDRLDPDRQCLELDSGETLHYDFLSLNTGSTLVPPACDPSVTVLSMRPLSQLKTGYDQLLERWQAGAATDAEPRPFRVLAVGGGAAGVESVLAVVNRLRTLRPDRPVQAELQTRGPTVLPGYPSGARRLALRALEQAGVAVRTGTRWTTGSAPACDLLLWAAGAQAHAWQRTPQRRGRLAVSPEGFVQIDGAAVERRPAMRRGACGVAMHLRRLAEQHVHRQVDGISPSPLGRGVGVRGDGVGSGSGNQSGPAPATLSPQAPRPANAPTHTPTPLPRGEGLNGGAPATAEGVNRGARPSPRPTTQEPQR